MVGVDTHTVTLEVKGIQAECGASKFILMEVRPAPYPPIDDVRIYLSASHLEGREEGGRMKGTAICLESSYLKLQLACN